jgi:hypothetical protein
MFLFFSSNFQGLYTKYLATSKCLYQWPPFVLLENEWRFLVKKALTIITQNIQWDGYSLTLYSIYTIFYGICQQYWSRAASTSVQSDHDIHRMLIDSSHFWPSSEQCRSWSDGTDVLADLDLHCLHVIKLYIWRKVLIIITQNIQWDGCRLYIDSCNTKPLFQRVT